MTCCWATAPARRCRRPAAPRQVAAPPPTGFGASSVAIRSRPPSRRVDWCSWPSMPRFSCWSAEAAPPDAEAAASSAGERARPDGPGAESRPARAPAPPEAVEPLGPAPARADRRDPGAVRALELRAPVDQPAPLRDGGSRSAPGAAQGGAGHAHALDHPPRLGRGLLADRRGDRPVPAGVVAPDLRQGVQPRGDRRDRREAGRELTGRVWPRKELDEQMRSHSTTVWSGAWVALIRVPPSGTWKRRRADLFQRAAEWIGPSTADEQAGLDLLLRRYLGGFARPAWPMRPNGRGSTSRR